MFVKNDSRDFSEVLASLRRETGRSQRKVASDFGVSQALLSHYENGAREPKNDFILWACDYFDVTADYLLGRDSERKPKSLPTPQDCEDTLRLISAINKVFDMLKDFGDPELYTAVVNYLAIPAENITVLLNDPAAKYEPSRDAKLKLAESVFVTRARRLRTEPEKND